MSATRARRSAYSIIVAIIAAVHVGVAAQQPPPIGIAAVTVGAGPYTFDTAEQHRLRVVVVAKGLVHPFSVAFLPNGDALVTERGARLRLVHGATGATPTLDPQAVAGLPTVPAGRGGGIQEVALHPKFAANNLVYFTYNKNTPPGQEPRQSAIALGRGKFDGKALTAVEEVFVGDWRAGNSGSRMAFGADGLLYISTGAPDGDFAGRLDNVYGKILRLRDDGKPAAGNPFADRAGARPEIFSYGHRDQLGLAILANGTVLATDHGPNGGDEVNVILPGRNYGWPTSSYGRNYDGSRVSTLPVTAGIEQPALLWFPSIAPDGLMVYTGDRFAAWKGNLFVGSARRGEIPRTGGLERVVVNDKLEEIRRETLLTDLHQRIRDVRQGPDGLIYAVTDEDDGVMLRLEPLTPQP